MVNDKFDKTLRGLKPSTPLSTLTEKLIEVILKVRSTDTVYRKKPKSRFFFKVRSTDTLYNFLIINTVTVLRTLKIALFFLFYKQCQPSGLVKSYFSIGVLRTINFSVAVLSI